MAVDAPFTVLIDYAHNEAAAESLLRTLRAYTPARLVAVFGCGGERSRLRRFGMGSVCARLADFCVITEDNNPDEPVEHIYGGYPGGAEAWLESPATPLPRYRTGGRPLLRAGPPSPGISWRFRQRPRDDDRTQWGQGAVCGREVVEEYWDNKRAVLR